MDLFNNTTDWTQSFKPLITKYKDKKHPLNYQNLYQLLIMVVLSAQDSDSNINNIAPKLFENFPDITSLAKADEFTLATYLKNVVFYENKIKWLLEIASSLQNQNKIPLTMKDLTSLKGIGRKSANVILREAKKNPEGIMVDLHVIRVLNKLGIVDSKEANKIESQLMQIIPKYMWSDLGMAISFLGRETCKPTNPDHNHCILNNVCNYYKNN